MKEKGFIKNILTVVGGNGVYLLSNILLGFLLPMILDVADYGYYKIYTLYVGYCGLLNFGFPDGILFRYGGCDYNQLNKPLFRTYSRLFLGLQGVMTLLVVGIAAFLRGEYALIIGFVGLNLIWYNVTLYYQYLSQATSRFKEFSLRKVLQAVGTIVVLVVLLLGKRFGLFARVSYITFILILQAISVILLAWYVSTYREITFGPAVGWREALPELKLIFRKGLMMTLAYEVAQLILLMDRQFVSVLFPVETYAQYAFAYNILSCVTALVTAVSTVLFPMLKKLRQEDALQKFEGTLALVSCLVGVCLVGVWPVEWLIGWLLPSYEGALTYVRILFPTLLFTSGISIVTFTYYKVLDRIREYLFISLGTLAVSFALSCTAVYVWRVPEAVSWTSVAAILVWYVAAIGNLGKGKTVKWLRSLVYTLLICAAFYAAQSLPFGKWGNAGIYLAAYCLISMLVFAGRWRTYLGGNRRQDR